MTHSIYVMQSEAGFVKIGVSNDPQRRLIEITQQQPFGAKIAHVTADDDCSAFAVERVAHSLLFAFRKRGEWFDATVEQAIDAIRLARERLKNQDNGLAIRCAKPHRVKKLAYLTDEQAAWISEYRFSRRIQSENEAIRQLITIGLETAARRKEPAND